jgi:8-oxo-dGTP pyrophosphatase MutT (NUDIX family)
MKNDALFCVVQKAFIEKDGKVLVLFNLAGKLDLPGGKIQEGEINVEDRNSLIDTLKREVKEETNLEIDVLDPLSVWYHEYLPGHRNYGKKSYVVGFNCKYLSGELKISDEHSGFRWVDKNDYEEVGDETPLFSALRKYFKG